MPSLFAESELLDLIDKVKKGERLNHDAGVRLMKSQDILALGTMANIIRERINGHQTFFMLNQPSDYTNVHDATMLYGDLESKEKQINHLLELRAQQDQTGEFLSFVPTGVGATTGIEDLKVLAISRILLDNFDHIKASWNTLGLKLTQVSLAFGVDDLAGSAVTKKALTQMIQKAGRDAVDRAGLGGVQ